MKYVINKGKHYANFTWNRLFPFTCNKIEASVIFDEACATTATPSGVNKLDGISSLKIHNNSGRIGWMAKDGKISLYGYVYNNGQRTYVKIIDVLPETIVNYSIEYVAGKWKFNINGKYLELNGSLSFIRLKCYPYFGGKAVAPCDMTINIIKYKGII